MRCISEIDSYYAYYSGLQVARRIWKDVIHAHSDLSQCSACRAGPFEGDGTLLLVTSYRLYWKIVLLLNLTNKWEQVLVLFAGTGAYKNVLVSVEQSPGD